jgi:hypothetical protein
MEIHSMEKLLQIPAWLIAVALMVATLLLIGLAVTGKTLSWQNNQLRRFIDAFVDQPWELVTDSKDFDIQCVYRHEVEGLEDQPVVMAYPTAVMSARTESIVRDNTNGTWKLTVAYQNKTAAYLTNIEKGETFILPATKSLLSKTWKRCPPTVK